MGFLNNSRCHASQADADAAYWGATPPAVTPGKLTTVSFSGGGWYFNQFDTTGPAPVLQASSLVPSITYPTCDRMEAFNDGMTVGGAIAAVWIVVYLIRIQGWSTR